MCVEVSKEISFGGGVSGEHSLAEITHLRLQGQLWHQHPPIHSEKITVQVGTTQPRDLVIGGTENIWEVHLM